MSAIRWDGETGDGVLFVEFSVPVEHAASKVRRPAMLAEQMADDFIQQREQAGQKS